MAQCDSVKARAWRQRFDLFQRSNLSVRQFCAQQRLEVHSFQYWSRRLGRGQTTLRRGHATTQTGQATGRGGQASKQNGRAGRLGVADAWSARLVPKAVDAGGKVLEASGDVTIRVGARVSIKVRADRLDAVGRVLELVLDSTRPSSESFQPVILRGGARR